MPKPKLLAYDKDRKFIKIGSTGSDWTYSFRYSGQQTNRELLELMHEVHDRFAGAGENKEEVEKYIGKTLPDKAAIRKLKT